MAGNDTFDVVMTTSEWEKPLAAFDYGDHSDEPHKLSTAFHDNIARKYAHRHHNRDRAGHAVQGEDENSKAGMPVLAHHGLTHHHKHRHHRHGEHAESLIFADKSSIAHAESSRKRLAIDQKSGDEQQKEHANGNLQPIEGLANSVHDNLPHSIPQLAYDPYEQALLSNNPVHLDGLHFDWKDGEHENVLFDWAGEHEEMHHPFRQSEHLDFGREHANNWVDHWASDDVLHATNDNLLAKHPDMHKLSHHGKHGIDDFPVAHRNVFDGSYLYGHHSPA